MTPRPRQLKTRQAAKAPTRAADNEGQGDAGRAVAAEQGLDDGSESVQTADNVAETPSEAGLGQTRVLELVLEPALEPVLELALGLECPTKERQDPLRGQQMTSNNMKLQAAQPAR